MVDWKTITFECLKRGFVSCRFCRYNFCCVKSELSHLHIFKFSHYSFVFKLCVFARNIRFGRNDAKFCLPQIAQIFADVVCMVQAKFWKSIFSSSIITTHPDFSRGFAYFHNLSRIYSWIFTFAFLCL
jgi:hypothetical protein